MRLLLLLTVYTLLLTACGGGGGSESNEAASGGGTNEGTGTQNPTGTQTFIREANLSCKAPEAVSASGNYSFELAFPNLPALSQAIAMHPLPNNSSIWVVALRGGQLVSFTNNPAADTVSTVLDISNQVTTSGEFGFTGFAFHPNFPNDNRLFVLYSDANQGGRSTLSSFSVNTSDLTASNEQILLTLDQPATNHNGGNIDFGPEGYLYIGFGDGGADRNTAQDLQSLYGSLLRIDIDNGSPYSIPTDNPFNTGQASCPAGNSNTANSCPEIFAYGLRNPWRWSFDSVTNDLWLADVGQTTFEEVNRINSGHNYGWPIMEANSCFNGSNCNTDGLSLPITQYGRDTGVSIVGGYVYRGTALADLVGQYIFGDTFSPPVLSIAANSDTNAAYTQLTTANFTLGSFAQDNAGEIYALDLASTGPGSAIYKLSGDSATTTTMPENLSETGCFNVANKTAPQGVVAYQTNSTLWSDGASKSRFFAIKDGESIDVNADGDFIFPVGSVLIKHFLAGEQYLETRLMVHFANGWQGYSYEWNQSQTEAVLLEQGKLVDAGTFTHTIPNRNQCFECHTAAAGTSLGLEASQQHYQDASLGANYLEYLSQTYLSQTVNSTNITAMTAIDDNTASVESRARSYLHSNCSGCHMPGASASFIDLRFSTPLMDTNTCNISATLGDFGFPDAARLNPGNAGQSALILRMQSLDSELRMPPLASTVVDETATAVISEWINGLSNCD